jgi:flagellar basal body-associated protein FliL
MMFPRSALCAGLFWAFAASTPVLASASAHKITASPDYIALDPFMVSVVENFKVRGFLVLEFTLHVRDSHQQDVIDTLRPRIRDQFVRTLMEYGAKVATVKRPPDLDAILARLQVDTDSMLGAGTAHVLVTQALVRPL